MTLWAVSDEKLTPLPRHRLDSEDRLETWIAQDPSLLGMDVLIIGRQVTTGFGKRIDLLAIDDEGNLVIIELKRDMTSRETVAQVLDYASWVNALSPEAINGIASDYLKKPLADAFKERFETAIPDNINTSHRLLIVASELDDSSERIVQYLSTVCSLDINVVFFTCFQHNGVELVGRSWLMDPVAVEARVRPPSQSWDKFPNLALVSYFKKQIEENRAYFQSTKRQLIFKQDRGDGKRHWDVTALKKSARVRQRGRFDGDIAFWQGGLNQVAAVHPLDNETCLRFYLTSDKDFEFFHDAVTKSLQSVKWSSAVAAGDDDLDEKEDG